MAKTSQHYEAIAEVYDDLSTYKEDLEKKLQIVSRKANHKPTAEDEIQRALVNAQRLASVDLNNTIDFAMAREVINATNA